MDQGKSGQVALLPIQPPYARAILEGTKKYEFRKRAFARKVSHAVVYVTSPVKKVVGFFEVNGIFSDTPQAIWSRFHQHGGIDHQAFSAYYGDAPQAVAIGIRALKILEEPLPLSAFCSKLKAPQSYAYFSHTHFNRLKRATVKI